MSASTSTTGELRRALKARHLSMIAIGGSIGTGLFVASGATISQAGPGGAVLAYMVVLPPGAFGLTVSMAGPLPPSLGQGAGIASLQPSQPNVATPPADFAGLPTVATPRTVSITPPIVSFMRIVKARTLVAWKGFIDWIDALYL